MNTKETAHLLAVARAVWPGMYVGQETIAIWTRVLIDIDPAEAASALERHIKLSAFEPHPADIRRNVVEARTSNDARWEDAWRELTETARRYGLRIEDEHRGYLPPYAIGPTRDDGSVIEDHPDTRRYPGLAAWPGWSSSAVARAVNAIGYRAFLLTDETGYGTIRAQFRDVFNAEKEREAVSAQSGETYMGLDAAETGRSGAEGPKAIKHTLNAIPIKRGEICGDE